MREFRRPIALSLMFVGKRLLICAARKACRLRFIGYNSFRSIATDETGGVFLFLDETNFLLGLSKARYRIEFGSPYSNSRVLRSLSSMDQQ